MRGILLALLAHTTMTSPAEANLSFLLLRCVDPIRVGDLPDTTGLPENSEMAEMGIDMFGADDDLLIPTKGGGCTGSFRSDLSRTLLADLFLPAMEARGLANRCRGGAPPGNTEQVVAFGQPHAEGPHHVVTIMVGDVDPVIGFTHTIWDTATNRGQICFGG